MTPYEMWIIIRKNGDFTDFNDPLICHQHQHSEQFLSIHITVAWSLQNIRKKFQLNLSYDYISFWYRQPHFYIFKPKLNSFTREMTIFNIV